MLHARRDQTSSLCRKVSVQAAAILQDDSHGPRSFPDDGRASARDPIPRVSLTFTTSCADTSVPDTWK